MKGIGGFKSFCQGESHKASDKPCQDYALFESRGSFSMAVVSDGHGGARYFRSNIGSQMAVNCTKKAMERFVKESKTSDLFANFPLEQFGVNLTDKELKNERYQYLKWLTSSIIAQWHKEIRKHAVSTPISDWEKTHVAPEYIKEFNDKVQSVDGTFEKMYGCTLIVYVQTPSFWIAFQIGDGKAVFFDVVDGSIVANQPIPWDERCFLNKTTSICDSEAVQEFRYCCCGNGKFPEAVFLGSDGIDDTYGDGDKLTDFYIRLYKEVATTSENKAEKVLEEDLPVISRLGSKDDMSVACVYNKNRQHIIDNYLLMSQWQIAKIHERTGALEKRIKELKAKIARLEDCRNMTDAQRIEIQYANNDLNRANDEIDKLEEQISSIHNADANFKTRKKIG
ncbi:protein phosphatase 2C domain-containing protein [Bacteroides acidifaciens]|uniref:protein phosphatase 2C domain-containing protein n=1 Tax=Bacteroides acidifaciens TaxID=85831 RepID=UPI0025ADE932|nr:protein phosphatase 2C domain-containing protein [Bacteroides acidifaciens]